jgi:hypothetical protein
MPGHRNDLVRVLNPPRADYERVKKVYDQDCTNIVDGAGQQLAHSKTVFAANVLNGTDGFGTFSLQAFVPLFEILLGITRLP